MHLKIQGMRSQVSCASSGPGADLKKVGVCCLLVLNSLVQPGQLGFALLHILLIQPAYVSAYVNHVIFVY